MSSRLIFGCIVWLCTTAMAAFASSALGADAAANEPRVALVIGNSAYKVDPLKNPVNDAEDMSKALQALGFRVTLRKDATYRQMIEAIGEFGRELKKGGVGLFYFAGHGVQSKGRNYLVPVNANVASEGELEFEAIDANRMLAAMDDAGNRVNLVILDACRNNPFARSFRSATRGLAQMDAAKGSYVAFATAPGSVAADGSGNNGLYTEHLLKSLREPDTDIHKVFTRVTAEVSRVTGGKQVPWTASSLTGDFAFRTQVAVAAPTPPADPRADDRALWDSVKDAKNPAELEAYVEKFPKGLFVTVARARLKSLAAQPPTQVAMAAPASAQRSSTNAAVFAGEDTDFGVSPTSSPRRTQFHAPTPLEIPGGKTIRTVDLKPLLDSQPNAVVVDVLESKDRRTTIPGAVWIHGAGSGFGSAEKSRFVSAMEKLTSGDKRRPLVFLCLNSQCWLSYNAALHAIEAGYTNVYWYRGGTDAWRGAGHSIRSVTAHNW
ncbi:MAG: caspase family protein [Burkholderiales bacterium]